MVLNKSYYRKKRYDVHYLLFGLFKISDVHAITEGREKEILKKWVRPFVKIKRVKEYR